MGENILKTIILDDNCAFLEFLRGLLSKFDFISVIAEADSAEKALVEVEKETPDLMIADIRLPGMDGMELAGVLKNRFPGTRGILITLHDDDRYRAQAQRLGFSYIPKSSLIDDLPRLLEKLAENKENQSFN